MPSLPTTPPQVDHATEPTYAGAPVPPPAPAEPARSVEPRADAVVDPAALHLTDDAAVKRNTFPSRPGYPSGMTDLQTHLHVEAWVANTAYAKSVWVDVHVFGHDGALVRAESLPLAYTRPAGDGGDLFVLESEVYQGLVATPGSVDPRPDARLVQYRLYAEVGGRVLTDGLLHRCTLAPDSASR